MEGDVQQALGETEPARAARVQSFRIQGLPGRCSWQGQSGAGTRVTVHTDYASLFFFSSFPFILSFSPLLHVSI